MVSDRILSFRCRLSVQLHLGPCPGPYWPSLSCPRPFPHTRVLNSHVDTYTDMHNNMYMCMYNMYMYHVSCIMSMSM